MTSLLNQITQQLKALSETPALDAQVLLAHIVEKPHSWILAHPELIPSSVQKEKLNEALTQLENHTPLPYIIGHWEFFGMDFTVSPDVLIPRPETEELIERALSWLHDKENLLGLDIGTGSGCIPVSLAINAPDLVLRAVDISSSALNVARQNATKHGVSDRIEFIESDLLSSLQPATFDLITANLPYVPTVTLHNLDVYTSEPSLALDGGADGLDLIRRLLEDAPRYLALKGLILLEIDSSHGEKALEIAKDAFPYAETELSHDLSGRDRFISIQN